MPFPKTEFRTNDKMKPLDIFKNISLSAFYYLIAYHKIILREKIRVYFLVILSIFFVTALNAQNKGDSISIQLGDVVNKPIYEQKRNEHGSLYHSLWGTHYEPLYYKAVSVKAISLNSLYGGLSILREFKDLHTLVLKDKNEYLYLLRPLGGSTSFLNSSFFKNIYDIDDLEETYIGDFITEAFTIVHPYSFLASNLMAKKVDLISNRYDIAYISTGEATDTVADGSNIRGNLITITRLPFTEQEKVFTNVEQLLEELYKGDTYNVDQQLYIRTRLFDMLIGDWNKIPESWGWITALKSDSVIFEPMVLDRNHAYPKIEGILFKPLLKMLGLGFINNYDEKLDNVKKFNTLGYALDMALTQKSEEGVWLEQAKYLQVYLTDQLINNAFSTLPEEVQDENMQDIKRKLMGRRNQIEDIAHRYYLELQKTPVITGTNNDDRFVFGEDEMGNLHIQIYNSNSDQPYFDRHYSSKQTKEIWVYGLEGNDIFEGNRPTNRIKTLLIGGKGENHYNLTSDRKVKVYESQSQQQRLADTSPVKIIYPRNEENALKYDYEKLSHKKLSVTPIGLYDSDLGINLGTSITYTVNGFKRSPYTQWHQLSFDYINGFTYQGIFPDYDGRKSFHLSAFIGSPAYFSNFFGYGNSTAGNKDENKNFNRVHLEKYAVTPAFYYQIDKDQTFNIASSLEINKVGNPKNRDRYINQIYDDNNDIFDTKFFFHLNVRYVLDKKTNNIISKYKLELSTGGIFNLGNMGRYVPYTTANLSVNIHLISHLSFATEVNAKALFSDKYDFFQSATTELRGFRNNRFIGKQSFYQFSEFRWDMGELKNHFTPVEYGLFTGVDYGRVWYPDEDSNKWHASYGGGFWLTLFKEFTGKVSFFTSNDDQRFMLQLGMGF